MHDLTAPTADDVLACRVQAELPLLSLSAASVKGDEIVYRADQRGGPAVFSLQQYGLSGACGTVGRYSAAVVLDRENPLTLRLELAFDTDALAFAGASQSRLPYETWSDVAAHAVRFRSSAVIPVGPQRCVVRGLLEIAGVTRLQTFDAELIDRQVDPITGTDVAELLIRGRMSNAAFGIPLGQLSLCDRVELVLRTRIELEA